MGRFCGKRPKLDESAMQQLAWWASFGTSRADVARRLGVRRQIVDNYLAGSCKRFNLVRAAAKSSD
jgi:DNA-binding CsgD family transcriptional regulator